MTNHAATVPGPATNYGPWIHETFRPGVGWKRYPFRKRISPSWTRRHLVPDGVLVVQLTDGVRYVDFQIHELLQAADSSEEWRKLLGVFVNELAK
jgi:hypothetical protein